MTKLLFVQPLRRGTLNEEESEAQKSLHPKRNARLLCAFSTLRRFPIVSEVLCRQFIFLIKCAQIAPLTAIKAGTAHRNIKSVRTALEKISSNMFSQ
jgi:hypothetical protein